MMPNVMIRLEVEGMRHAVLHAFTQHQLELEKRVSEGLKTTLDNLDFQKVIDAAINDFVGRELPKLISEALQRQANQVMSDLSGEENIKAIFRWVITEFVYAKMKA